VGDKRADFRRKNVAEGSGTFIRHYLELRTSPAWLGQSIGCRRLIEFLEIEHMRHAGLENGRLMAPQQQLRDFGIHPRDISAAIDEAKRRRLISLDIGAKPAGVRKAPLLFRLTYLQTREEIEAGRVVWIEPTHDWRRFQAPAGASFQMEPSAPPSEPAKIKSQCSNWKRNPGNPFHLERPAAEVGHPATGQPVEEATILPFPASVPNGSIYLDSGTQQPEGEEQQQQQRVASSPSSRPSKKSGPAKTDTSQGDIFAVAFIPPDGEQGDQRPDDEAFDPLSDLPFYRFWRIWPRAGYVPNAGDLLLAHRLFWAVATMPRGAEKVTARATGFIRNALAMEGSGAPSINPVGWLTGGQKSKPALPPGVTESRARTGVMLRTKREGRNWTPEDLAREGKESGLTESDIVEIEGGRMSAPPRQLKPIFRALGLP